MDRADHAVVLNPPSMARYTPLVAEGGLLVVNTTLIEAEPGRDDIEVVEVPCTALARQAGDDKLVSVVALGALVGRRPVRGARQRPPRARDPARDEEAGS